MSGQRPGDDPAQDGDGRSRPPRTFRTPLRGHAFAGEIPESALRPGRGVTLDREPSNPADPFAVAVWLEDEADRRWRIGYLDRTVAARLAPRIDAGATVTAVLEGWIDEPDGRWERPLVRIEMVDAPAGGAPETVHAAVWGRPPGMRRRRVDPGDG